MYFQSFCVVAPVSELRQNFVFWIVGPALCDIYIYVGTTWLWIIQAYWKRQQPSYVWLRFPQLLGAEKLFGNEKGADVWRHFKPYLFNALAQLYPLLLSKCQFKSALLIASLISVPLVTKLSRIPSWITVCYLKDEVSVHGATENRKKAGSACYRLVQNLLLPVCYPRISRLRDTEL